MKIIVARYKYFLISFLFCILIWIKYPEFGCTILNNALSNIFQMLSILPAVMVILSLLDIWIPREYFIKYMGCNSGIIGIALSFLIAFFAAGPMYAAFPFVEVLSRKGVKLSNIIIFLNAWCVTKLSTLLFEISSLGYEFTLLRFIINVPAVIIMGFLVNFLINRRNHIN
ncbi:MAG: permease [Paraclostridium sp.]|uniref:permease n=1 Tax=Paraclostridium sp. TaxID=2023273 RepID=UPI003F4089D9